MVRDKKVVVVALLIPAQTLRRRMTSEGHGIVDISSRDDCSGIHVNVARTGWMCRSSGMRKYGLRTAATLKPCYRLASKPVRTSRGDAGHPGLSIHALVATHHRMGLDESQQRDYIPCVLGAAYWAGNESRHYIHNGARNPGRWWI